MAFSEYMNFTDKLCITLWVKLFLNKHMYLRTFSQERIFIQKGFYLIVAAYLSVIQVVIFTLNTKIGFSLSNSRLNVCISLYKFELSFKELLRKKLQSPLTPK